MNVALETFFSFSEGYNWLHRQVCLENNYFFDESSLRGACEKGHLEIVKLLLNKGLEWTERIASSAKENIRSWAKEEGLLMFLNINNVVP
nr:hypothetical protein Clen_291 [Cedratvirus lena]